MYVTNLEENLTKSQKENESLKRQLYEKNGKIGSLEQEICYLKSVLANVDEISSLITTIKRSNSLPMSSSFDPPPQKKMKMDRKRESSTSDSGSLMFDDQELSGSDWGLLDENIDWPLAGLSNVENHNSDITSYLTNLEPESAIQDPNLSSAQLQHSQIPAGVCLHVCDKKISLEFCAYCSNRALENWANQD